MSRPRKVSDEDIFAATHRAMSRLGPNELTLAEIAAEAGVTAGALVQRFGSKRDLLLALSERYSGGTADMFTGLRQTAGSPLAALRAYGECLAQLAVSPAALARNLSYLQIDLTDPDFRRHLEAMARSTRAELKALVEAAIAAHELSPTAEPRRLARTIEAVLSGSMMAWAHYQEGTAAEWMREDLEAVLAPFLSASVAKRTKRTSRPGKPKALPPQKPGRKR